MSKFFWLQVELKRAQKFRARVGLGSGSGFEIRYRVGLGFHEFVSKPVGLLKAIYKYAMLLIIEPIRFSTAGVGVYWAQALSGFWLM